MWLSSRPNKWYLEWRNTVSSIAPHLSYPSTSCTYLAQSWRWSTIYLRHQRLGLLPNQHINWAWCVSLRDELGARSTDSIGRFTRFLDISTVYLKNLWYSGICVTIQNEPSWRKGFLEKARNAKTRCCSGGPTLRISNTTWYIWRNINTKPSYQGSAKVICTEKDLLKQILFER